MYQYILNIYIISIFFCEYIYTQPFLMFSQSFENILNIVDLQLSRFDYDFQ